MENLADYLSTLVITPVTSESDLEICKDCYEGYSEDKAKNEKVMYYKVFCNAEKIVDNTIYFLQSEKSQKFYLILERSEFETHDLQEILIACGMWFEPSND